MTKANASHDGACIEIGIDAHPSIRSVTSDDYRITYDDLVLGFIAEGDPSNLPAIASTKRRERTRSLRSRRSRSEVVESSTR